MPKIGYLVQIFEKENSLSDVSRVLGPDEAPGVLELGRGADLPGVELCVIASLELLQVLVGDRLLQQVVHF